MTKYKPTSHEIVLGGMFIALFFLASNIIPPIYIVPQVPVTLQILVVALMGSMLGLRTGLLSLAALFLATLVGLPMMSQFHSGPAAFVGPTGGFIIGFVFVVALSGLCRDFFENGKALIFSGNKRKIALTVALMATMIIGVLLDYFCGAVGLSLYMHTGLVANFVATLVFLPIDAAKCILATVICVTFVFTPSLARLAGVRTH
jgi:biotin transport system substrate-specific component